MNVIWFLLGCINTLTTGINALALYYGGPDPATFILAVAAAGAALWCFSNIETKEQE
jgi:hypothetical protein